MLFCVTTRGRDKVFSNPLDSGMVRMASRRTLLLEVWKVMQLVGPTPGMFEKNGIWVAVLAEGSAVPTMGYNGLPPKTPTGDVPTALAPPTLLEPLPKPNPSWVPISRAKLRVAATT